MKGKTLFNHGIFRAYERKRLEQFNIFEEIDPPRQGKMLPDISSGAHQRDSNIGGGESTRAPDRLLHGLECRENGVVKIAASQGEPHLVGDRRVQERFQKNGSFTEPQKILLVCDGGAAPAQDRMSISVVDAPAAGTISMLMRSHCHASLRAISICGHRRVG
jgi:hypothetical protein